MPILLRLKKLDSAHCRKSIFHFPNETCKYHSRKLQTAWEICLKYKWELLRLLIQAYIKKVINIFLTTDKKKSIFLVVLSIVTTSHAVFKKKKLMEGHIKQYSVTAVSYGQLQLHYLRIFPYQCTTTVLAVMNGNSTNFSKRFHS